jgi:Carboxypeptidase regulatory-like domain
LHGQATGSFSGVVSDKSGSTISQAPVTATLQGSNASRKSNTGDAGHNLIPLLPVGIYTLHAEFAGFQPVESKDVRLQVDRARELNLSLVSPSVTPHVEVSAAAVAAATTLIPLSGR